MASLPANYTIKTRRGNYFSKSFEFFEDDGVTPKDLSGCTAILRVYHNNSDDTILIFEDGAGLSIHDNVIDVFKDASEMEMPESPGQFLYTLSINYPAGADPIVELYGAFLIISSDGTADIASLVEFLKPGGFTIDDNYVLTSKTYWQEFLKDALIPSVSGDDVYDESNWELLPKYLIAMLIIKSALLRELKASYAKASQGDASEEPLVKRIVTGPTEVEYQDTGKLLDSLFKSSGNSPSAYQELCGDICGLGSKLGVKLPGCTGNKLPPTLFKIGKPEETSTTVFTLLNKYML